MKKIIVIKITVGVENVNVQEEKELAVKKFHLTDELMKMF